MIRSGSCRRARSLPLLWRIGEGVHGRWHLVGPRGEIEEHRRRLRDVERRLRARRGDAGDVLAERELLVREPTTLAAEHERHRPAQRGRAETLHAFLGTDRYPTAQRIPATGSKNVDRVGDRVLQTGHPLGRREHVFGVHRGPVRRVDVVQPRVRKPQHPQVEVGQHPGHRAKILGRLDLVQHDA